MVSVSHHVAVFTQLVVLMYPLFGAFFAFFESPSSLATNMLACCMDTVFF